MDSPRVHEIELYPYETFLTLLDYETKRAKRYNDATTLIRLAVEAESEDEEQEPQYGAEVFAINVLNIQLRDVDIPCRINNEFLVFMPRTDEASAKIVCDRLEALFLKEAEVYEKVSFKLNAYLGVASIPNEDRTISSKLLMDNAITALEHARKHQHSKTVVFSEISKE